VSGSPSDPDGKREASQLGDAAELVKIYRQEAWNTYRIICRGPEITLFINGTLMCQFTDRDPKQAASKGIHRPPDAPRTTDEDRVQEHPAEGTPTTNTRGGRTVIGPRARSRPGPPIGIEFTKDQAQSLLLCRGNRVVPVHPTGLRKTPEPILAASEPATAGGAMGPQPPPAQPDGPTVREDRHRARKLRARGTPGPKGCRCTNQGLPHQTLHRAPRHSIVTG
jgi:hypothetical protein